MIQITSLVRVLVTSEILISVTRIGLGRALPEENFPIIIVALFN